jgi:hypothetical protein
MKPTLSGCKVKRNFRLNLQHENRSGEKLLARKHKRIIANPKQMALQLLRKDTSYLRVRKKKL